MPHLSPAYLPIKRRESHGYRDGPKTGIFFHSASHSKANSGLSKGAMIGIIVGALGAIFVLLALVVLLFLRRRRRSQRVMEPKTPVDAELPLQGPNMRFTPISPQQPMPTFSSPVFSRPRMSVHSIAPSYYASNNDSRSSFDSTTALVPPVPRVPTLAMPRVPSRAQQGVMVSPDLSQYRCPGV